MSRHNNGGRAFPIPYDAVARGMTLRDYFAAAALPGIMIDPPTKKMMGSDWGQYIAAAAYELADAMIRERDAEGA